MILEVTRGWGRILSYFIQTLCTEKDCMWTLNTNAVFNISVFNFVLDVMIQR